MKKKPTYTGLLTQCNVVECQPLLDSSTAKVKIKTEQPVNTEWETGVEETLQSEIMSSTLE